MASNGWTLPGKLFWQWAARSIVSGIIIGSLLGLGWMLFSLYTTSSHSAFANIAFMMSFFIDTFFVFLVTAFGTLLGMALQTADVIGRLIVEGRRQLLTRYLWAVLISLSIGVFSRYVNVEQHVGYNALAVVGLNFIVTSTLAFAGAYRVYCLYAVLTAKQRVSYLAEQKRAPFWKKLGHWILPGLDKNKVLWPLLHAGVIASISLVFAVYLSSASHNSHLSNVFYAAISMIGFILWGITRRALDILKFWGKRERLYPHFEDYR